MFVFRCSSRRLFDDCQVFGHHQRLGRDVHLDSQIKLHRRPLKDATIHQRLTESCSRWVSPVTSPILCIRVGKHLPVAYFYQRSLSRNQ